MSVNKAIILGRLGNDVKVSYTDSGKAVGFFSIATSEKYKDGQGEIKERTTWHRIKAFGKTAELCEKYLSKGSQVYIEGSFSNSKWTDKTTGLEKETSEIITQSVQFISGNKGEKSNGRLQETSRNSGMPD